VKLLHLLKTFLRSRFVRVAFLGCIGVIVQTSIFETLSFWLKIMEPSTAVLVSAEFGILTSFFLNNRFTFDGHAKKPLLVRLLRFHIVVSGSLAIQWISIFIAEHTTTSFLIIQCAYIAGIVIGFISNYIGYSLWVWQHHESTTELK